MMLVVKTYDERSKQASDLDGETETETKTKTQDGEQENDRTHIEDLRGSRTVAESEQCWKRNANLRRRKTKDWKDFHIPYPLRYHLFPSTGEQ